MKSLSSHTAERLIQFRWPLLLSIALVSWFAIGETDKLQLYSSNESFLMEGDDSLRLMNTFKDLFGNDDFVFVLYESDDFFQVESIRRLAKVAEDLEAEVPHLYDITWLGNAEWIEGREESIEIDPLMDPIPESEAELARFRELALSEPSFVNNLISPNGRVYRRPCKEFQCGPVSGRWLQTHTALRCSVRTAST